MSSCGVFGNDLARKKDPSGGCENGRAYHAQRRILTRELIDVYPVLDERAGAKNRVVGAGQALIARDLQGETFPADKNRITTARRCESWVLQRSGSAT
jgi:hypothetical protein